MAQALERIDRLGENERTAKEKRAAASAEDQRRAADLFSDRSKLAQRVSQLRVGGFDQTVKLAEEREDLEVLEALASRARKGKGKQWKARLALTEEALEKVQERRKDRFMWKPGDVEVVKDEVIEPDPDLEVPPELLEVLEKRNARIRERQKEQDSGEPE